MLGAQQAGCGCGARAGGSGDRGACLLTEVVMMSLHTGRGEQVRAEESQSHVLSLQRLCGLQDLRGRVLPTAKSIREPGVEPWEEGAGLEDQNTWKRQHWA